MNLKWVVDGVSDHSSLFPLCVLSLLARVECKSGGILHSTRYACFRSVGNAVHKHMPCRPHQTTC
jgi:hypothetical protein